MYKEAKESKMLGAEFMLNPLYNKFDDCIFGALKTTKSCNGDILRDIYLNCEIVMRKDIHDFIEKAKIFQRMVGYRIETWNKL